MKRRYRFPKYRNCVICSEQFEVTRYRGQAITCGPECAKARKRDMKILNRPNANAKARKRRWANIEFCRAREVIYSREARARDPKKSRDSVQRYQAANMDKVRERRAQYYAANRERERERQRMWAAANREQVNARKRAFYAANKGAPVRAWTRQQ